MNALSKEACAQLSPRQFAERIDRFFEEDHRSRYGDVPNLMLRIGALDVLDAANVKAKDGAFQKRPLGLFYRARFQISVTFQFAADQNHVLDLVREGRNWLDPAIQIQAAASRQGQILSARMAFECLMEFVHFAETGSLIRAKKSKLGSFRK